MKSDTSVAGLVLAASVAVVLSVAVIDAQAINVKQMSPNSSSEQRNNNGLMSFNQDQQSQMMPGQTPNQNGDFRYQQLGQLGPTPNQDVVPMQQGMQQGMHQGMHQGQMFGNMPGMHSFHPMNMMQNGLSFMQGRMPNMFQQGHLGQHGGFMSNMPNQPDFFGRQGSGMMQHAQNQHSFFGQHGGGYLPNIANQPNYFGGQGFFPGQQMGPGFGQAFGSQRGMTHQHQNGQHDQFGMQSNQNPMQNSLSQVNSPPTASPNHRYELNQQHLQQAPGRMFN